MNKVTEKVIHEVRFIETDDGFRIEVKGDKERIREMGFGPGMGFGHKMGMMGCGPGMHGQHRRRRHGRHGRRHRFGPAAWGGWWDEGGEDVDDADFDAPEKSPKDV